VKALLAEDRDFLRPLVQAVVQELLEAEMTEALGAEKGERTPARLGHTAAVTTAAPWSPESVQAEVEVEQMAEMLEAAERAFWQRIRERGWQPSLEEAHLLMAQEGPRCSRTARPPFSSAGIASVRNCSPMESRFESGSSSTIRTDPEHILLLRRDALRRAPAVLSQARLVR
jgi:Transposase, Mutator family